MDSLIVAAARALSAGDPLGALNLVALRDDAPALALRGIAMAQLGDLGRARTLVRAAARSFGTRDVLARARCVVAEAELALASRDLAWPENELDQARDVLEARGDRFNVAHAQLIAIRRRALIGDMDGAEARLGKLRAPSLSPAQRATHSLVHAAIAIRRLQTRRARDALTRALSAARDSGIPALIAEVERAARTLTEPAARVTLRSRTRLRTLPEVERLYRSRTLVVDACRYAVLIQHKAVPLTRSPVLFTLARLLAHAWPLDVSRDELVTRAFRARRADESYRARLRVELGRLRRALREIASIEATAGGFRLSPRTVREVAVLEPPIDEAHATVLALLADGESWSSSALSLALGVSQRSVQRALDELAARGKVQAFGKGRARRWMTPPLPGIATALLLPAPLPSD